MFQLVEAVDVVGLQFAAGYVEQSADHFSHHVAQEGAAADGEDQLFAVGGTRQLGRDNLALGGTLLVVFFRAAGSRVGGEVGHVVKASGCITHGLFVERKRIVPTVAPG